jgi:hypothetical protein
MRVTAGVAAPQAAPDVCVAYDLLVTSTIRRLLSQFNCGQVLARQERAAYEYALSFDPLLPQQLWPPGYRGAAVEERHREFRLVLAKRLAVLAPLEK